MKVKPIKEDLVILADKIIDERKKAGWSQEELAQKLDVSRQAVSKWEGAQATPDLQRVVKMAELFGVSTDYLLRDEGDAQRNADSTVYLGETALRTVSLEEAQSFLEMKKRQIPRIALGVSLCIASPAVLIALAGFLDDSPVVIPEDFATGLGMVVLLLMVAFAVFLFVSSGQKGERFERFEKEPFETAYGVAAMVEERKRSRESVLGKKLAAGIALCVLSAVTLFIPVMVEAPDYTFCIATALLLVIVAFGVNLIIKSASEKGSYQILLEEGDYTRSNKHADNKLGGLSGAYWCLIVAIYLGSSFITEAWDRTWIIWPVAALLFAALFSVLKGRVAEK